MNWWTELINKLKFCMLVINRTNVVLYNTSNTFLTSKNLLFFHMPKKVKKKCKKKKIHCNKSTKKTIDLLKRGKHIYIIDLFFINFSINLWWFLRFGGSIECLEAFAYLLLIFYFEKGSAKFSSMWVKEKWQAEWVNFERFGRYPKN